jgi:IS1 family transposase
VRKVDGQDRIRYLRGRTCGAEFSERKRTALWNTKIREAKAVAVGEHLAEGCALKGTARLVRVNASTVRRLNQRLGEQGQAFHEEQVQAVAVDAVQADERHGYAAHTGEPAWEAELIDPASKFVLAHVQGQRHEQLIRRLLCDGARRLRNRHALVLFTDGEPSDATLFPALFAQPYQPSRQGERGRHPKLCFRIPRTLAHVQLIQHRAGCRVTDSEIRYVQGSRKPLAQALKKLGYAKLNTSAIERRNGTARRMSAHQVRKTLAFSRRPETQVALGWWGLTVYNWCRSHRSLRRRLAEPVGKKVPVAIPRDGFGLSHVHFHSQGDPSHATLPPTGVR